MTILLAACAGALGALGRWSLDKGGQCALSHGRDPLAAKSGIVVVNILGCFLAGGATQLLLGEALALVGAGFLGGFTTFSMAVLDALTLWEAGQRLRALGLALGTWGACLVAAWAGGSIAVASM